MIAFHVRADHFEVSSVWSKPFEHFRNMQPVNHFYSALSNGSIVTLVDQRHIVLAIPNTPREVSGWETGLGLFLTLL